MSERDIHPRHAVGSGIHGELSNRMHDRPLELRDAVLSAVAVGCLFLVMCIGAAHGF